MISGYAPEAELEERLLFDVAAERGVGPAALALQFALNTDLEARFRMPVANSNEDEVEELLLNRNTVIGLSDAGAHASQLCDACLPTFLLRRWVREKGTFSLEEAVRMLTSRRWHPTRLMRAPPLGSRPGLWARPSVYNA